MNGEKGFVYRGFEKQERDEAASILVSTLIVRFHLLNPEKENAYIH